MPADSTLPDIMDEARNLSFPQGESTFGSWRDMEHSLANFKGEEIDKLTTPEGDKIEFSLQSYFDLHKLTRVRLYLKTERKAPTTSKKRKQESDTASRTMLREAQDKGFAESLLADRAQKEKKEERLMEELSKAKEVEEIHAAGLRIVLDEPKEGEPQVVVRVRHVDLGLIQRTFKPYQAMAAVYDWVGSLQLIPVYFSLCMAPGNVLDPSLPVEDAEGIVLFMFRILMHVLHFFAFLFVVNHPSLLVNARKGPKRRTMIILKSQIMESVMVDRVTNIHATSRPPSVKCVKPGVWFPEMRPGRFKNLLQR